MKFNTEQESIDYVIRFLEALGFTDIQQTQQENKYLHYDIRANYKGRKCEFELKRRNFPSHKYGDVIIEDYKYNNLFQDLLSERADKCYIVTLFEDYLCINNIEDEIPIFQDRYAAHTTEFENRDIIRHKYATFKLGKLYDYGSEQ